METNVRDTAFIIEGGGMRASYTAGLINVLLDHEIYFDYVAGISAGASCAVNYLSRDRDRVRRSFVELAADPEFGGIRSLIRGKGFFNSEYIYETIGREGQAMPFDFKAFKENPACIRIGAWCLEEARVIYFSKDHMESLEDVMKIVRASSTLPFLMPPTEYRGRVYFDGGLGGGIAIDAAIQDGYRKFFVILSRPEGYYKKPLKNPALAKTLLKRRPRLADAAIERWQNYNRQKEQVIELAEEGRAYIVYPADSTVSRNETDPAVLARNYDKGYEQGAAEVCRWKSFLQG